MDNLLKDLYDNDYIEKLSEEINRPVNIDVPAIFSEDQYKIIIKNIKTFEQNLNPDEDVCLSFANFGNSILMHVHEINFEPSVLMIFKGSINGTESVLIQHINQINFLITSAKRNNPDKPRPPIGFSIP